MKLFILSILFITAQGAYAQANADAIVGKWMVIPKQNLTIQVFKTSFGYAGKISDLKNNTNNTKKGFLIPEKLIYNPDEKVWEHRKIHNPKDGTLEVHAYKGFKFLGTDKIFKRL